MTMVTNLQPALSLSGVHANIDQYHILEGVDLEVPKGELTVLLGRNGAGKSTTLRTIMGLTTVKAGHIKFGDQDITDWATPRWSAARRKCPCSAIATKALRVSGSSITILFRVGIKYAIFYHLCDLSAR